MGTVITATDFTFIGIALFAVLWRYSGLPEAEWEHVAMGLMFLLSARGIELWSTTFSNEPNLGVILASFFGGWAAVFDIIGGAIIVEGALRNVYDLWQA